MRSQVVIGSVCRTGDRSGGGLFGKNRPSKAAIRKIARAILEAAKAV